jgi:hypothetical protein
VAKLQMHKEDLGALAPWWQNYKCTKKTLRLSALVAKLQMHKEDLAP